MLKYNRNLNQEFLINLKISNSLPESFDPKNKIGDKSMIIWDNNGTRASKIITSEIPVELYNDLKNLILKMHNNETIITFDFNIGTYHLIVESPYICRLQIIELNSRRYKEKSKGKKEALYAIKHIDKKYYENTKLVEASIYVIEENNNSIYAKKIFYMICNDFHNEQLSCLKKYLINDIIDMLLAFL